MKKKMSFDEFFESLLQRKEFLAAFKQVGPTEQSGVRDVALGLFSRFEISEENVSGYIDEVCATVAKSGTFAGVNAMETGLCNACHSLSRRYSLAANA